MHEYESTRRVCYEEGAVFVPVCERCGRYVRPNTSVFVGDHGISPQPNATCTKCGPTKMLFEEFIG